MKILEGTASEPYFIDAHAVITGLVDGLEEFFTNLSAQVKKLYPTLDFSRSELEWAAATVQSRQLLLPDGPERELDGVKVPERTKSCLVPVIDMLTHRANALAASAQ